MWKRVPEHNNQFKKLRVIGLHFLITLLFISITLSFCLAHTHIHIERGDGYLAQFLIIAADMFKYPVTGRSHTW